MDRQRMNFEVCHLQLAWPNYLLRYRCTPCASPLRIFASPNVSRILTIYARGHNPTRTREYAADFVAMFIISSEQRPKASSRLQLFSFCRPKAKSSFRLLE